MQPCCNLYICLNYFKLQLIVRYKKSITFLLLILQLFISTPVQLYHHHNNTDSNLRNTTTVSEICPICTHQYTAYYNDYVFAEICLIQPQTHQKFAPVIYRFTTTSYSSLSNKSPPLHASFIV